MGKYDSQVATAKRLISKFGGAAQIMRVKEVAGTNPWDNETQTTVHDCMAVMLDFNKRDIDGTHIVRGDKLVYIAADDVAVTPKTSDKFKFGSNEWAIINVENLSPSGQDILFTLQVRR